MPPEKTSGILFLTGISGSGKSAIARELARKLRCKMYDIDVLLTGSERMSVKSIFERKGESYFRRRERETIAELTRRLRSCGKRAVVSLGGGSLMNAATARLVARTGTLIYLVVSCREAARRLLKSYDRPLILDSSGKRLS
ncbi:MAG: shikimate kinase, partial [Candidatus Zixiibacteriota bacterium]